MCTHKLCGNLPDKSRRGGLAPSTAARVQLALAGRLLSLLARCMLRRWLLAGGEFPAKPVSTFSEGTTMQRRFRIGVAFSGLLMFFSSAAPADDQGLLVVQDGQPRCVIAVGAEPSPAERTAARELQVFLKQVR